MSAEFLTRGSSSGGGVGPQRWYRSAVLVAVLAVAVAYFGAGFYFVQPNERGVVRWFGHIPDSQKRVEPGLHYALPWPICRVEKPKTTEVRRVYVGLHPDVRGAIARGDIQAIAASPRTDMLTGDINILKVTLVVQYQVCDPAAYLTGAEDPDGLVRNTVQAMLIETLAGLPVDRLLTTAKVELQTKTLSQSQALLDRYGCGVRLVATELESTDPPSAVAEAFNEVVSAKKNGEQAVDQATARANTVLPRARGEASRIRQEAEAYRLGVVNRARGDANRFLQLLAEYRKAPGVTADRLRLETFDQILPNVRVYVLDNKEGDRPTNLKIIDGAP
jgi:membrane protease subunit HflK